MSIFIKPGFWVEAKKGYTEWLNLTNLISESGGTQNLQSVTDLGSVTSNNITLDGNKKELQIENAGELRAIIGDTAAEGFVSLFKSNGAMAELKVNQDSVGTDQFQYPTNPDITEVQTLATTGDIPLIFTNATTAALSLATLDSTYTTAKTGDKVHAKDIIGGGLIYEKTSTGWVSYSISIVA